MYVYVCMRTQPQTCSVLSNQRFPLFQRLPPPCNICAATLLQQISSDTRGIGASRHTKKMLFWIARTDSLFVLSEEQINEIINSCKIHKGFIHKGLIQNKLKLAKLAEQDSYRAPLMRLLQALPQVLRWFEVRMPIGSLLVCKEEFQIFSNCMQS